MIRKIRVHPFVLFPLKDQFAVFRRHSNLVARLEFAGQQFRGEWVEQMFLNRTLGGIARNKLVIQCSRKNCLGARLVTIKMLPGIALVTVIQFVEFTSNVVCKTASVAHDGHRICIWLPLKFA